jgi:hypothetical protein
MASDDGAAGRRESAATRPRSHLFAVRLWKHDGTDGPEYRGIAREVVSGAFCNFRDWSQLASFMTVRVEEDEGALTEWAEGEA